MKKEKPKVWRTHRTVRTDQVLYVKRLAGNSVRITEEGLPNCLRLSEPNTMEVLANLLLECATYARSMEAAVTAKPHRRMLDPKAVERFMGRKL